MVGPFEEAHTHSYGNLGHQVFSVLDSIIGSKVYIEVGSCY